MPKKKVQSTKYKVQSTKSKSRKIKQPTYKTLRLSNRIKNPHPKITGGFKLFGQAVKHLIKRKKLFLGLLLVSLVLNLLFVRGLSNASNLADVKGLFEGIFSGFGGQITLGVALFSVLIADAAKAPSDAAAVYQFVSILLLSLACIWALRHTVGTKMKIRVRDAFYKGMYPLVPFILIICLIALQLLPLVVASFLYGTVVAGGLAITTLEKVVWLILIFLLVIFSLYLVSSSIFALYIVTLPDTSPIQALRAARDLVRFRRWGVLRRLLVLPLCLFLVGALLVIPLIFINSTIAEWVFYIFSLASLFVIHGYNYHLYRELL